MIPSLIISSWDVNAKNRIVPNTQKVSPTVWWSLSYRLWYAVVVSSVYLCIVPSILKVAWKLVIDYLFLNFVIYLQKRLEEKCVEMCFPLLLYLNFSSKIALHVLEAVYIQSTIVGVGFSVRFFSL
ncbi:hypothetical protein ACJX0J_007252, partial [Zea mays]